MLNRIQHLINIFKEKKVNYAISRKWHKIKKNVNTESIRTKEITQIYRNKWINLINRPNALLPIIYGNISGIISTDYVPENAYYNKIEPVLNNRAYALAYADKNFYEQFFDDFISLFPETLLRCINGIYYDKDYIPLETMPSLSKLLSKRGSYIIKPATESSGGFKVSELLIHDGSIYFNKGNYQLQKFLTTAKEYFGPDFIIQERIKQNEWFASFNVTSINTVRLFTYRSVKSADVIPLHSIIRFGKPGSLVDNQAAGGLSCGIDKNGKLNNFAIDKYGTKYVKLSFIKEKSGQIVPGLKDMIHLAKQLASKYYYHRLLGFDFCLDIQNKVRLLEINCKNIEINFLQMNNGPLFGAYTNEVINYCASGRKSVVLDFYV